MVDVVHVMPTLLASFMASLVECVEALTVVLAVGQNDADDDGRRSPSTNAVCGAGETQQQPG